MDLQEIKGKVFERIKGYDGYLDFKFRYYEKLRPKRDEKTIRLTQQGDEI